MQSVGIFECQQKLQEGFMKDKVTGTRPKTKTPIRSVVIKILISFAIFILASNLASNYINLMFMRTELISTMKQLILIELKQMYNFVSTQYEIFKYSQNTAESIKTIEEYGLKELENQKSVVMAVDLDKNVYFLASKTVANRNFDDDTVFKQMKDNYLNDINEAIIEFKYNGDDYFGVYKFHSKWNLFIIRAEELGEFYAPSTRIFRIVILIIIVITLISVVIGSLVLNQTLRFVRNITNALLDMQASQQLKLIDMQGASNDDIGYLGISFNALSNTINNLLVIFRKFVTRDVALEAYQKNYILLDGKQAELVILFSDIKSFTFITEILGTDIIKLLNIHYDRAIKSIHENDGIIGSIIGDALLAVYGTVETDSRIPSKSLKAVKSAYQIQAAAMRLRQEMTDKKEIMLQKRGGFTDEEENLIKAVMLEVGVGIDGGDVFYGKIGSSSRMTNTVIGDNVNSASRLEGLTRIYKVPVICSEFVKKEIETVDGTHDYLFVELDQVQVKGKTIGKRVYWPVPMELVDKDMRTELDNFSSGLEHYYAGRWKEAAAAFNKCTLALAEPFKARTAMSKPSRWNGIWTMTTK